MLNRIYIHNIKSFLNFEIKLTTTQLLMGPNGVGKTALFELLDSVRQLLSENCRIYDAFPIEDRARGLGSESGPMRVEVDLQDSKENIYSFGLVIEVDAERGLQRIEKEWLNYNGKPLFSAELGEAQLYRDNHSRGPSFPMDWTLSGVGFLMSNKDNTLLTAFKKRFERLYVIKIRPEKMADESRAESSRPHQSLQNFADWYRHLSLAMPDRLQKLIGDLQLRLPGIQRLRFQDAGDGKILYVDFEASPKDVASFRFSRLSDGQKALIGLYTILHTLSSGEGATLCIDEPENYLALPEIQPWIDEVTELQESEDTNDSVQILMISHHPRMINFLANDQGIWLERKDGTGPTRTHRIGEDSKENCLPISDLVERGWIYETVE